MNMILKQAAPILSAQASTVTSREDIRGRLIGVDQRSVEEQMNALRYLEGEAPFARTEIAKISIQNAINEMKAILGPPKAPEVEPEMTPYSSPGSEDGVPEDA